MHKEVTIMPHAVCSYLGIGYIESEANFQQDKCVPCCYAIIPKGQLSSVTGVF